MTISRSDDRSLALGAACAGALASAWALHCLPALAAVSRPLRSTLGIGDGTSDGEGVALTFDDGPHRQGTPAVLEILARRGARATFFLVGEQIQRSPSLAGEIVAAGHQVGLHCHRHRNLLRLTPRGVRDDLARATALIEQASGRSPRLYRPPYGLFNASALRWSRQHGMRPLLWSHWGRDWEARASPESIARQAVSGLGSGSVMLLHDADDYGAPGSWRRTAGALPRILDELERRGLRAVSPG